MKIKRHSLETKQKIVDLRGQGHTNSQIAKATGVPLGTVGRILSDAKKTTPRIPRRRSRRAVRGSSLQHQVKSVLAMNIPDTVKLLAIAGLVKTEI